MPGVKKCEVVSTRDFIIRVTCEPQHHQPHADQVPGSRVVLYMYKNTDGNPSGKWNSTGSVADPDPHHIWIRIRIRTTVKGGIRIRITVKGRIRISIKVKSRIRIRNTGHRYGKVSGSFSDKNQYQYTHAGWNPSKNLFYICNLSLRKTFSLTLDQGCE